MTDSKDTLNHSPNPVLALKTIRLCLEQRRFSDALEALKEFGKLERAYALAEVERQSRQQGHYDAQGYCDNPARGY